jgi:hypothetical protein
VAEGRSRSNRCGARTVVRNASTLDRSASFEYLSHSLSDRLWRIRPNLVHRMSGAHRAFCCPTLLPCACRKTPRRLGPPAGFCLELRPLRTHWGVGGTGCARAASKLGARIADRYCPLGQCPRPRRSSAANVYRFACFSLRRNVGHSSDRRCFFHIIFDGN